jgi:ArsR family transcriptional regulator
MNKQINPHEKVSELLASIGNPVRVQILLAIGTGEACVCHLESLLGLRQAYISQHLMALRKQEIITTRRDGKYIFYRLVEPEVLDIIRKVGRLAGVSEEALVIQDHSNCMCPKCSSKETIISTNLPVSGQA